MNWRLLALSDRLLGAMSADPEGGRSLIDVLQWAGYDVPQKYMEGIRDLGHPSYDEGWDEGHFTGFGYALASATLYLQYQMMSESIRQALSRHLSSPSQLPAALIDGLGRIEESITGALAMEAFREERRNLVFAHRLNITFLDLALLREDLEIRARRWEKDIPGWSDAIWPGEAWRQLVTNTVVYASGAIGRFRCKLTHPRDPGPEPGPGPGPGH